MANARASAVLHYIRRLVAVSETGAGSDRALLQHFVTHSDEEAFTALVQRYGPLVLNVCRRILGHEQDTEDAFQATFLVLARKARSIHRPDSVGSWLYGVAVRIAQKARIRNVRHHEREVILSEVAISDPEPEWIWRELQPILDEEVSRLPDCYRLPFILCHLQGKSNAEAAVQLGCRPGTIFSRLARARGLLRERLTRRGLALSTATLAAVLTEKAAQAAVPLILESATIQAGGHFLVGATSSAGNISARALALAQGVMKNMFLTKLKILFAVAVIGSLSVTAAGLWTYHAAAGATPANDEKPPDRVARDTGGLTSVIKVPSRKDGVVLVIGTELAAGHKLPPEQVVSAKIEGEPRQFRRLRKGDRIEEGQLLALMDDPLANSDVAIKTAKLAAAKADQVASEKTRDEARKRYDVYERLHQSKSTNVSIEDVRSAELTWVRYTYETKSKEEAVKVAEQELSQTRTLLKMSEIRSPCSGIIKRICVHRGEGVHALEPVIIIQVPEEDE